jgi:hypothetical protein
MATKKGIYSVFKNIIKKENVLSQSKLHEKFFESQIVNLTPIFNTQTQEFSSVLHQSLVTSKENQVISFFQEGLDNIAYWHCHGRAIQSLFPIHQNLLCNTSVTLEELIELISSSVFQWIN